MVVLFIPSHSGGMKLRVAIGPMFRQARKFKGCRSRILSFDATLDAPCLMPFCSAKLLAFFTVVMSVSAAMIFSSLLQSSGRVLTCLGTGQSHAVRSR